METAERFASILIELINGGSEHVAFLFRGIVFALRYEPFFLHDRRRSVESTRVQFPRGTRASSVRMGSGNRNGKDAEKTSVTKQVQ